MESNLGNKMFKGAIWSGIERLAVQSIQFILGIVLARILSPDDFGIVGLILVFTAISNVFINSGFATALIQKQDRSPDDLSTVFIFNIGISILCYVIIFFLAPYIASYYEIDLLKSLLRVLALSLLLNALYAVPNTLFLIKLDFKSLAKINFVSTIISGIVAIYLAYRGYGPWALVIQLLIKSVIALLMNWIYMHWKPQLVFSVQSFKTLFNFGYKLLISNILNRFVNDLSSLLIGKYLSTADLGYYTRGLQFTDFVSSTLNSIVDRVLLPSLAPLQNNLEKLISKMKVVIKVIAFINVPIFFGLCILAKPIIVLLLTEKWLLAVPIMQIFCFSRLITIISGVNMNMLYITGRTDLTLRQNYVKIAVRIILLALALPYGIVYIALAELLSTFIHFFINSYYPGKLLHFGAIEQFKCITSILLTGIIMFAGVVLVTYYIDNNLFKIIAGSITGVIIYLTTAHFMKIKEMKLIYNLVVKINKR